MTGVNQPTTITTTPAFGPAEWLAKYIDLGGGYAIVGDAIWLHWLLSRDVDEAAIKAHERVLRGRPGWRDAVKALILAQTVREMADG